MLTNDVVSFEQLDPVNPAISSSESIYNYLKVFFHSFLSLLTVFHLSHGPPQIISLVFTFT